MVRGTCSLEVVVGANTESSENVEVEDGGSRAALF